MTIELIRAIVRQTTVLIAQLATSGGWRAPLVQVAGQVCPDLVTELERQGVSRQVSANMFGMGLEGLDELLWAIVYREGPITREELIQRLQMDASELDRALERLVGSARIERAGEGATAKYHAAQLLLPLGSPVGWEAAVFDHFQAMVRTIVCRLREDRVVPNLADRIGGSTYTIDIWPGHPLEQEAYAILAQQRTALCDLWERAEAFNAEHPRPDNYTQAVYYFGQCLVPQGSGGRDDGD